MLKEYPKIAAQLDNLNLLIVDDDRLINQLTSNVLRALGFRHVATAFSAENGVDILRSWPVDILICDWRMPNMDGIALTHLIRHGKYTSINPFMPILMLTGNAEWGQIHEARDAGVTEYLIKPFTVRELCVRIAEMIENPRELVFCDSFCGPSRRRKTMPPPGGRERRQSEARA